jgi:hypothetical protein
VRLCEQPGLVLGHPNNTQRLFLNPDRIGTPKPSSECVVVQLSFGFLTVLLLNVTRSPPVITHTIAHWTASLVMSTQDVSLLEGRTVQLVFRMRGAKVYAMQFLAR